MVLGGAMVQNSELQWGRYRHSARNRPMLEVERERELLVQAQRGDQRALTELIDCHMRLAVKVASRYARDGLSAHDLISEGVLGLLEAVRRFDLRHQTRFASYAAWWVRAFIRRYALANRRIVGVPTTRGARVARARLRQTERELTQRLGRAPQRDEIALSLGISEHDVELVDVALSHRDVSLTVSEGAQAFEPIDEQPGPEESFVEHEGRARMQEAVADAMGLLSTRERTVLSKQFFSDAGDSLSSMGRELGVSRQRVGQILAGAREKLRGKLEAVA
jgi:RNA polymerase sigma-32 factor